jgi:hypothetical protein
VSLSPEQRSQRAKAAAFTRWSREDPRDAMHHVREGQHRRDLDDVDPERILPEAERERRAAALRKARMARLALASSRARSKDGPK